MDKCPTCGSVKKEVRKLTHIPGTGESTDAVNGG